MANPVTVPMTESLTFYAVKNKEGKWFRRKGYSGYGDTWVEKITSARIYAKIGGARSVVTFFAKNYPTYGVPDLVVLKVIEMGIIDETERVTGVKP